MALMNTKTSYGSVTKVFHWLIVVLVITMLCLGFSLGLLPSNGLKGELYNIHKLIGLAIMIIMILRLIWTFINPKPSLPANISRVQVIAARSVHWSFYVVLIAMPFVGWILSSAAGKYPHLFGIQFALPIAKSKPVAELFSEIHEILAFVIIALICMHVLATLWHHYVNKDNTLKKML